MRKLLAACLGLIILSSFFSNSQKEKLRLPVEFAKIPAGTFHFTVNTDSTTKITLEEFYMSKYEVSNKQYREFYNEISRDLSTEEKAKIASDTIAWSNVTNSPGPMRQYYYQHPAYNEYPVVN